MAQFRRAILAKAFRGELAKRDPNDEPAQKLLERLQQERETRRQGSRSDARHSRSIWQERSSTAPFHLPDEWRWTTIGSVFEVEVGGTPSRKESSYWNGDISWVSSSEVAFHRILSTRERITTEGMRHSSAKIRPIGTVLLAMIGEGKTRGQVAILGIPAATNQNVASLLCSETPIAAEYVYWWLYYRYNETRSAGEGGAQPALNAPRVRSIPIPIAPLHEQKIIASKVEELFSFADDVEKSAKLAHTRAERLEGAIFTRAFQGELVPQDPDDESGAALLQRITAHRVAASRKPRSPPILESESRTSITPKSL